MAWVISERQFSIDPPPFTWHGRAPETPGGISELKAWRAALGQGLGHIGHPATSDIRNGVEGALRKAGVGGRVVVRVEVWEGNLYQGVGREVGDEDLVYLRDPERKG